ncbi:hypothetical protein P43SY_009625 [Pythium insidiosum]|uniref:Vesicle transport v-SNARE N-terminal domain-containing protein n=1 Tax=Pythium insidiosum TaxID=114742 RepID=A0AAD5LLL7_PYTIN|nr:hypothetical protein P43SY_009625 [Pythium insidiosum]
MTESFMGYKEDFEQCRDEAMEDIKAIGDAKTAGQNATDRNECIQRAENSVEEVERYLRILEVESRAGDAQERRKMHQALRTCKSQVDKLKAHVEKSKLIADSRQRLEDRPENMTKQEEMARIQKRIDRTGNHLDDAKQVMIESEAIAQNITSNLQVQREQLMNARTNVDDAREDADEASAHLESLKRKHQWQIMSLYFIIVVLFAHCVYRLILFLT